MPQGEISQPGRAFARLHYLEKLCQQPGQPQQGGQSELGICCETAREFFSSRVSSVTSQVSQLGLEILSGSRTPRVDPINKSPKTDLSVK